MKIAILIERSDVFLGGAERSIFELSAQISSMGHEITLLAAKGTSAAKHVKILCGDSAGKRTSLGEFEAAARAYLAQEQFDIVHAVVPMAIADVYQPRGGTYPETIRQNAASYDNGFVEVIKKATSFLNFRRGQLCGAEKMIARSKNGPVIACLSAYVARQFKEHYRCADERLRVIANGVKTDRAADAAEFAEVKGNILSSYSLDEDNPVFFLFAANNFRLKGLYQLIKAAAMCKAKEPAAKFQILVAGNDHSMHAQNLANRLDVDGRITFLGPVAHIQNALVHADVAVLPTFYDPASRFILEGLAMGKPAITTSYNGAADLFENGRHGIVIDDARNTEALADALLYYSKRTTLEAAKQAIMEDEIKDRVSIHAHAHRLIELYEEILSAKGQSK
ncbi:MAG: hypothetical protein A2Y07_01605 [Planctomycetes bacterium GWF2_50_10]|nr:MAG: hypothetical protein A2Y07_01605 [Planctomycetes bacterium GWF2_50_10]